jgi:hypothetical protein
MRLSTDISLFELSVYYDKTWRERKRHTTSNPNNHLPTLVPNSTLAGYPCLAHSFDRDSAHCTSNTRTPFRARHHCFKIALRKVETLRTHSLEQKSARGGGEGQQEKRTQYSQSDTRP